MSTKRQLSKKQCIAIIAAIDTWVEDNAYQLHMLGTSDERYTFAPAILGTTTYPHPAIVYSAQKVIECLMRINKWDYDTASEWYDYNTVRALPYYTNAPILVEDIDG